MSEIATLSDRIDDSKDKEIIRKIRKDLEEQKTRAQLKEQEADELRVQRDKLREEKNDNLMKYSKQLDYERNEKRVYKSECERLSVRSRFIEEENKKMKIKQESNNNELELTLREKDDLHEEIRKKDDMIHGMQRRIAELEDENLQNETKNHENAMRVSDQDRRWETDAKR